MTAVFLTPDETAQRLHIKKSTLATMRQRGDGPPYVKTGYRNILYRLVDIEAWETARTFSSTTQEKEA